MNANDRIRDDFDGLTARLRDDAPARETESAAGERVWAHLTAEVAASTEAASRPGAIDGCAGFRSLVPAWNAGRLAEPRRLLLEDHLAGCVACRQALRAPRPEAAELSPAATVSHRPLARWAVAAGLIGACALAGAAWVKTLRNPGAEGRVEQVRGALFFVQGAEAGPAPMAARLRSGEGVRTGKDSTALLRLDDGSRVEMKDRTELSLQPRADGVAIRLARGSVIVQAAHQKPGRHLYFATDDCLVSVVGTVFSVSSGTKGSRVSVVEGEVRVAQRGEESMIRPGQLVATSESVAGSSVAEEVAWSQDAETYREILRRLAGIRQELADAVPGTPGRHSTRLLDLSPPGTVFYAAVPNIGETLVTGRQFLMSRIAQDELLRSWAGRGAGVEKEVDEVFEHIRRFSSVLGDEIAISLSIDATGKCSGPLLLAELRDPEGLSGFVEGLPAGSGVHLLEGPLPLAAQRGELLMWVHDGILAASPSLEALQQLAGAPAPRARTPFLDRVADSYAQGAQYILSADLHTIVETASREGMEGLPDETARQQRAEALNRTGLLSLGSVIAEAKDLDGRRHDSMVFGFDGPRRGIASWLAEPAPMGGLEYVSPDARLVAAFVVKEPSEMLEDVMGLVGSNAAAQQAWSQAGAEKTVRAIASALGDEIVFALDGPLLPVPAWKLVLEAPDAMALEDAFQRGVDATRQAGATLSLTVDRQPGRTFFTMSREGAPFDLHAAWDGGYLVVGPTQALVERTLVQRAAGASLRDAPRFTALLPRDAYTDFSAILYEDLSGAVGALGSLAGGIDAGPKAGALTGALAALGGSARGPSLFCAYSEPDRIVLAGSSPSTIAGDLAALMTFGPMSRTAASEAAEREENKTAP